MATQQRRSKYDVSMKTLNSEGPPFRNGAIFQGALTPEACTVTTTKQINKGWVTLGPNLGVFPLEQTRHVGVAKSERHRLTNGEIIFEEFQLM